MEQKKINVIMVVDSWFPQENTAGEYGGIQVHVRELRASLQKHHPCQVELFYMAHPNPVIRFFWPLIGFFQILQYLRHQRADLLHVHGFTSALAGKLLSWCTNVPLIHTVHATTALDLKSFSPLRWLEALIFTKVTYDCQISVSQNFLRYSNVNQNQVVITNGVNTVKFNQVRVKKHDQPTLIWVGKNTHAKGVDVLRAAIARVRKKIPQLQTELVTGGQLYGYELIKAYKKAHLFVLPSRSEAQPLTLLEAWAARLPVIVTDVGDNARMVKDGKNGYIVEPDNVTQLTNKILKVLRARVSNIRMGEAGYKLVRRKYTWRHVARETFEVYQKTYREAETRKSSLLSILRHAV